MTEHISNNTADLADDIEEVDSDIPRKYGLSQLLRHLVCCSCFTTEHKPSNYISNLSNNNENKNNFPIAINGSRKKEDDSKKIPVNIHENLHNKKVTICSPTAQHVSASHDKESGNGDCRNGVNDKHTGGFHSEKEILLSEISEKNQNKKCFIIDLDETLVHSSFKFVKTADIKVTVEIDGTQHEVFVSKRPFVDEFLSELGDLFECVLFTASLGKYADPVTNFLDPTGIFEARLFREACAFKDGNYIKDLELIGRDVDNIVILDNSPVSYLLHPKHALQIVSWFDDPSDTALKDLIPYFKDLATSSLSVPEWLEGHIPPESAGILGYPPSNLHWILMQTLSVPAAITIYKQRLRESYHTCSSSNVSRRSSSRTSTESPDLPLPHHSMITQAININRPNSLTSPQDDDEDRPPVSSPVARPSSTICLDGDLNDEQVDYLIVSYPDQGLSDTTSSTNSTVNSEIVVTVMQN